MASNTPGRMIENACVGEPRRLGSTPTLRNTTDTTMTPMETRAKLLDLESLTISRCKDRGKATQMVHRMMRKFLLTSQDVHVLSCRKGKTKRSTCGIVSPMMTLNAHMPPNANANWKKDTACAPTLPKQWYMTCRVSETRW